METLGCRRCMLFVEMRKQFLWHTFFSDELWLLYPHKFMIEPVKNSFLFFDREAHLWYVAPDEVKSSSLLHNYLAILSPCEKENVSRKRGEQLQKAALLARVLVRTTIARCKLFPTDSNSSAAFSLICDQCQKIHLIWNQCQKIQSTFCQKQSSRSIRLCAVIRVALVL